MKKSIYRISLLSSLFLVLCVSCFDAKFNNPDDPFESKKTVGTNTSAAASATASAAASATASGAASTVGTMDASLWNFILVQTPSTVFTDYTSANGVITVTAGTTTDTALEFKATPTDSDVSISVTFSATTMASGKGIRIFARSAAAAEETNGSYMVSVTTSAVKLYSRPTSGSGAALAAASPIQLISPVVPDGSDHTLFFKVIGNLLTATIDGGSPTTVTDTQFTSAGKVGIIVEKGCTIALKSVVIKTGSAADSTSATATATATAAASPTPMATSTASATASATADSTATSGPTVALPYIEEFTAADIATFQTAAYAITPDGTTAMNTFTSGISACTISGGALTLGGARFTIGCKAPATVTTATSTPGGFFDLSTAGHNVIINVASVTDTNTAAKSLMVYIDNNTTSAFASPLGSASTVKILSSALVVGDNVFTMPAGSSTSFLQIRTESLVTVVINSIIIQ